MEENSKEIVMNNAWLIGDHIQAIAWQMAALIWISLTAGQAEKDQLNWR